MTVLLDGNQLTLEQVVKVLYKGQKVDLTIDAWE